MTSPSELLERDGDRAEIERAIADAAGGRGGVLLLEGPPGIGKSALLEAARLASEPHEALVLRARASELDRGFAFGVVHQLLEGVLAVAPPERRARLLGGAAARAGVLFDGGLAGVAEPEYGVLSGLYWLLANLTDDGPVVLLVDDLHWADVASLRLLEYLGRRIEGVSMLVCGTLRPNEPGAEADLLVDLAGGPSARTVRPRALGAAAVAELLRAALGGDPTPAFADAAARATTGNPLFLSALAREAATAGLRGAADEADELESIGARGLAPLVGRRLAALGPDATAVARAIAIGGERSSLEDVVVLSALDRGAVARAQDQLVRADVLVDGGTTFVHPLVRSAVSEGMPRAARMALHRVAAVRLAARGARATEVAAHHLVAEPAGDPAVVAVLREAASTAAAEGATETAVRLLRRAVEEPPPERRADVLLELGELEMRGQLPEGAAHIDEALALGLEPPDRVRARSQQAFLLVHTDPVAALDVAAEALAEAEEAGARLRLEAFVAESLTFVDAFAPRLQAHVAGIRAAAHPSVVGVAHLAVEAAMSGAPAERSAGLARRSLADGRLLADVGPGSSTWNLITHALRFAEDADGAQRALEEGERVVREQGLRFASFFVDQSWGYWHRDFGSAATGAARGRLGFDAILEAGLDVTAPALSAVTAENLVRLDRLAEAAELADRPLGPAVDTFMEPFALSVRGLVRSLDGRLDAAETDLRRVVALGDARGWRAPLATRGRLRLAELLAGRGAREEAAELAAHDVGVAGNAGTRGALGVALRVRGLAEDGDAAEATLREAVDALDGSPLRHERAAALYDLGATLRRRGRRAEARDHLKAALDLATRAESARLVRRTREELQVAGARVRRDVLTGVASLTPSERRVADLAAEGLSNRRIAESLWVTQKTVEVHLGSSYSKLGIRSRAGLAEALAA